MNTTFGVEDVLVSVVCKTYNQEKFIAQAIESVLMQQTDFKFELLINDDASTDSTTAIVLQYAAKYPDIVKPIIEKENQFSKGINSHFKNSFPRALGKYIAICDGDDYWTDPLKLQKQFDFMEKNENCTYVYTRAHMLKSNGIYHKDQSESINMPVLSDFEDVTNLGFMPTTLTIFFRKSIFENQFSDFLVNAFHGDWAILVIAASKGKIGFIDEFTCVYRIGIGILKTTNQVQKIKRGIILNEHLDRHTGYVFHKILRCKEKHYTLLTYMSIRDKKPLQAFYYFSVATYRSFIENNFSAFVANEWLFFKSALKILLTEK